MRFSASSRAIIIASSFSFSCSSFFAIAAWISTISASFWRFSASSFSFIAVSSLTLLVSSCVLLSPSLFFSASHIFWNSTFASLSCFFVSSRRRVSSRLRFSRSDSSMTDVLARRAATPVYFSGLMLCVIASLPCSVDWLRIIVSRKRRASVGR